MMGMVCRRAVALIGARRLAALRTLLVLYLGLAAVLLAVFAGSTFLFSVGPSGSVSPADDRGTFYAARLVISSFDPMSGAATGRAEIWIEEGDADWGAALTSLRIWTSSEPEKVYPIARTAGSLEILDESGGLVRAIAYEARGVELTLQGEARYFPFDEYTTNLDIAALTTDVPAETDVFPILLPRRTIVESEVPDISLKADWQYGCGPELTTPQLYECGLVLTASRSSYDRLVFILASVLFAALMYAGLMSAFTQIAVEQPLVLMFGIVGVALALPAVRDLIVPDNIRTGTLFDGLVVIPFLAVSLLMLAIVTFRVWRAFREAPEYD